MGALWKKKTKNTWTPKKQHKQNRFHMEMTSHYQTHKINYWQSGEMGIPLIVQDDYFPPISMFVTCIIDQCSGWAQCVVDVPGGSPAGLMTRL